jgi:sugar lactone lactonase YvrE
MDESGNLYVTNFGDGSVSKISITGAVTTFASGFTYPRGITIDNSSNLYVVCNNNLNVSTIFKITPAGNISEFVTIDNYMYGLSMDNIGNLYAAAPGYSAIRKFSNTGVVGIIANGLLNGVTDLVVTNDGNIYATATYNGTVYKISPTGTVSVVSSGFFFGGPSGIVVDGSDNLYLTSFGNNILGQPNSVTKISSTGIVTTIATGLDQPIGLAIDKTGNFYVVNSMKGNTPDGSVSKITIQ